MGIFILEKGTSPYWDGGQDASDCRSGLGHYAVGATTIAVHPPRRGRKGRGFRCPNHIARRLASMFPRGCGIQSRPCNFRQI